jgi:hypothetical protein
LAKFRDARSALLVSLALVILSGSLSGAEAMRLDPGDYQNHVGHAEALRGKGRLVEAIGEFGVAWKITVGRRPPPV